MGNYTLTQLRKPEAAFLEDRLTMLAVCKETHFFGNCQSVEPATGQGRRIRSAEQRKEMAENYGYFWSRRGDSTFENPSSTTAVHLTLILYDKNR